MKAGITTRRLTFREIFSSTIVYLAPENITFFDMSMSVSVDDRCLAA
jgi:hypothetical protein